MSTERLKRPMADQVYVDMKGRVLFVAAGLDGNMYMTFTRRPSGGLRRYVSPKLPPRKTREEAQADLDAYARARRLRMVAND